MAHDDHRPTEVCLDRVTPTPSDVVENRPGLSVVAATRNDDHGGNQLARTQIFVNGLGEQALRFKAPIELVLVEWNPPPDRPPLRDALSWPRSEWFQPRIVVVPPEVHRTFEHCDGLPLFQMIAKNVGIRHAKSEFVLCTNIDILLSDELFTFLQRDLDPGALYRVDRLDVDAQLDGKALPTPEECRALPWLRAHRRDGTHNPGEHPRPWHARARTRANRALWDLSHGGPLPNLFTWGCGDFTLTSREVWEGIHGYPEWPMYSFHLDSLAMIQAYGAGVQMVTLDPPRVIYHLEHGSGSGWTPEGARRLFDRLDAAGVPHLTGADYDRLARGVLRKARGFHPFNGASWGLDAESLREVSPN